MSKELDAVLEKGEYLEDGIYALDDDIEFVCGTFNHSNDAELLEFAKKHEGFAIASAYETEMTILLSRVPTKLSSKEMVIGSGFNYGSTNIVVDCPRRLLILAEND
jgi:hypothetical protein